MSEESLRVGFGEVDVTPDRPVRLAGYYFDRTSTSVHDRLCVRAMAFSDGRERVVLGVADLADLRGGMNTALPWIIPQAREKLRARCGLAPQNALFCAIHTHTGPDLSREPAYTATIPDALAEAARRALADLQPRRAAFGRDREPGLQFIRRYRMKDGSVRTNPGKMNPDIVEPLGAVNDTVGALSVSEGGTPVGALIHFALHCDTVGGTEISADWTHYAREHLRRALKRDVPVLTPVGPCGDVNHWNVREASSLRGFAETERIGARVAAAACRALDRAEPLAAGPVRARRRVVPLALRVPTAAELAEAEVVAARPAPTDADFTLDRVEAFRRIRAAKAGPVVEADVTVLTVGSLALVGIPGEYFTELGRDIQARSPFPHTLVCTLANTNLGYIGARWNYAEGGYETTSSLLAPGAGERLADTAVELLGEAAKG